MGWSKGSDIAEVFSDIILKDVPVEKRRKCVKKAFEVLVDSGWDEFDVPLFEYFVGKTLDHSDFLDDCDWQEHKKKQKKWKEKFGF